MTHDKTVISDDVALDDGAIASEQLAEALRFDLFAEVAYENFGGGGSGALLADGGLHLHGLVVHHVAVQVLYGVAAGLLILHVLWDMSD